MISKESPGKNKLDLSAGQLTGTGTLYCERHHIKQ